MATKISPVPVEPDEFLIDTSTEQEYRPTVVPAFRLLSGHNLKTTDADHVGTLGSVGG